MSLICVGQIKERYMFCLFDGYESWGERMALKNDESSSFRQSRTRINCARSHKKVTISRKSLRLSFLFAGWRLPVSVFPVQRIHGDSKRRHGRRYSWSVTKDFDTHEKTNERSCLLCVVLWTHERLWPLCIFFFEIAIFTLFVFVPGKGDLFGSDLSDEETSVQSSCDVKSLTYCDLQCILLNRLKDTLIQYPEFAETFHEEIKHDLTYNLKEGFDEGEVSTRLKRKNVEIYSDFRSWNHHFLRDYLRDKLASTTAGNVNFSQKMKKKTAWWETLNFGCEHKMRKKKQWIWHKTEQQLIFVSGKQLLWDERWDIHDAAINLGRGWRRWHLGGGTRRGSGWERSE